MSRIARERVAQQSPTEKNQSAKPSLGATHKSIKTSEKGGGIGSMSRASATQAGASQAEGSLGSKGQTPKHKLDEDAMNMNPQ